MATGIPSSTNDLKNEAMLRNTVAMKIISEEN
jgi:hypothetical protein